MDNVSSLTLQGISQFEQFELVELAKQDPDLVKIPDPEVDRTKYGEFVTAAAVVWLSVQGLRLLASWLNKRRSTETIAISGTVRDADGTERPITITWSRKESEAAEPEQLAALAKLLDVKLPSLPS